MPSEFQGRAAKLSDADVAEAARLLYCDVPSIRAVAAVESGGRSGFLPDKRPVILFESYQFHRRTGGRHDDQPDVSTPRWVRNYLGGRREYDRLAKAIALDREAALASTS